MEQRKSKSETALENVMRLEDIAEKKTKIYSRLFTDPSLAKDMESFSLRHQKRKEELLKILTGKVSKKEDDGGRYETNGEETEE